MRATEARRITNKAIDEKMANPKEMLSKFNALLKYVKETAKKGEDSFHISNRFYTSEEYNFFKEKAIEYGYTIEEDRLKQGFHMRW